MTPDSYVDGGDLIAARRSIRLLSILYCARETGFEPLPGRAIHTIAYLADALSPVWGLPILDAQVLKQTVRPNFPALQRDLDLLVGQGMVAVADLKLSTRASDKSPIRAKFALTPLAEPALDMIQSTSHFRHQFDFVREVTYGAAALGPEGLASVGSVDASYADPLADVGSIIDLDSPRAGRLTTADVARKFRELAPSADLTDAQLIHLYLRHLYSRLRAA